MVLSPSRGRVHGVRHDEGTTYYRCTVLQPVRGVIAECGGPGGGGLEAKLTAAHGSEFVRWACSVCGGAAALCTAAPPRTTPAAVALPVL